MRLVTIEGPALGGLVGDNTVTIRAAVDEAVRCRESGEAKTILFGLTGTGYFDMAAYSSYLDGTMTDSIPKDSDITAR